MAGLQCGNPRCWFLMFIPDDAPMVNQLKTPSATVECPKCQVKQEAADAWIRYEQWAEQRRLKGLYIPQESFMPEKPKVLVETDEDGSINRGHLVVRRGPA